MNSILVKKWALIIGIVVVLTAFLFVGVNTFYKAPDFKDYMPAECVGQCGGYACPVVIDKTQLVNETYNPKCDEWQNEDFVKIREHHDRIAFAIVLVLAILVLIIGAFIKVEAISYGFMFAGVVTLFGDITRYWDVLNDYLRFIILAIALAILIYMGYKKLNN